MGTRVSYEQDGSVATITMDDGKANALSLAMLDEIGEAFDRAEKDEAVVVLAGRPGRFSGGFDLELLLSGSSDAVPMLLGGFELAHRLLSFPRPIVTACTGHAYAMGAFILQSTDHRIGAAGEAHRITANEVAIGLTMPHSAMAICRARLDQPAFDQAMNLAAIFTPEAAVAAGFLDEVVPSAELLERARTVARSFAELDLDAHAATKARTRAHVLAELRAAIELDAADFEAMVA